MKPILFVTPPFTQLNTPYPATAYLKGFLKTKNIESHQQDLGIETLLQLFSKKGLTQLFAYAAELSNKADWSENDQRIFGLQANYIQTVDAVISFLQGKIPSMAKQICSGYFLPEANRFDQLEETEWAFGSMGMQD
ncbi:MAG: radical SAM protein, partial [Flavobacterium sp.]